MGPLRTLVKIASRLLGRALIFTAAWSLRALGYVVFMACRVAQHGGRSVRRIVAAGAPHVRSRRGLVPVAVVAALLMIVAATAASLRATADAPPRATPPKHQAAPTAGAQTPLTRARLQQLRVRIADPNARVAALTDIAEATITDLTPVDAQLRRRTAISPVDYKNVLRAAGAQVPDRRGRFPKVAPTGPTNWLQALGDLRESKLAPGLAKALNETLYSVALMRALARSQRTDAADTLLAFAFRHEGAFRDECGRLLRAMGDRSVPALLRAGVSKHPQAHRIKRYADYQLDRMNRARPEIALRLADADLRADILHAYGEVRHPAAVSAVIAHTDAESHKVRRAARWATLRYVSGRSPDAAKRRLRLPGGNTTQQEEALYLTYRQLARQNLAHALAAQTEDVAKDQPETAQRLLAEHTTRQLAEKLFASHDRRRQHATDAALERAEALAQRGRSTAAAQVIARLLAAAPDPLLPAQRRRMASIYKKHAQQLFSAGHYAAATQVVGTAIHILPADDARIKPLRALQLVAEALHAGVHHPASEWKLRQAVRIAPQFPQATGQLAALLSSRVTRAATAAGAVLFLSVALGIAARRRRHRRQRS